VLLGIVSLYVGAVFAVNGDRLVGQARGGAVSESVPEITRSVQRRNPMLLAVVVL